MLPLKGCGVSHIVVTPPPCVCWICVLLTHLFFVLSVLASVPFSVRPVINTFLSLRKNTERTSTKFADVITTTIRLNGYILGEIETMSRQQDAREN